ncbi:hypothetical protein HZA87_02125 [Candidatus Uhrbacteria bacterium]|nr:hypothetical protein [Candidatus Uhrbacteria bacterium]
MKTYSFDEAQTVVNKKIKESVATLQRELRTVKKTAFSLKAKTSKAYVSRSV